MPDHLNRRVAKLEEKVGHLERLNAPRQQHAASDSPQEASNQKDEPTGRQQTLPAHINPPPSSTEQSQKPWYKTFQGWKSGLEIVAIFAAVGYAYVTYRQWVDLGENFQIDQRAWVGFINLEEPMEPAVGNFTIGVTVENRGKTPATHATIRSGIAAPYCAPVLPTDPLTLLKSPVQTVETSLIPNHPQKGGAMALLLSDEVFRELKNKKECRLLVFASVDYCDVFGHAHFRHFCGYWHRSGKDFDVCESYNDGDEDYGKAPVACQAKPSTDVVTVTVTPN